MSRDSEPGLSRPLGGLEMFSARCHDHNNLNTMLALTIHTRAALDIGLVQITLQEMQHSCPLLTSRIVREGGREVFRPMEVPTLPIDRDIQCQDMLHTRFDTENGPLWRVQIITQSTFEKASKGLAFGPEMEAIIEDDSDLETRWRYYLRYLQGCLNQDIESFENSLGLEEEGRSVVIMTFHPAITDTPGALYWAKQFMSILDMKLESERPISAGEEQPVMPRSVETLLPECEPGWGLGSLGPVLSSVITQVTQLLPSSRPSPLAPLLRTPAPADSGPHSRSHFLRGWLAEEETRELLAQCCEDDISLHGLVLAVTLAATARVTCPGSEATLRASVVTNLRQHLSPAPRHGALSAPHEVSWRLSPVEDREQLWALAHSLTQHLTQAKADRLALRQVRSYAKMTAANNDIVFSESPDKITSEMSVTVLGDLGNIFRRESSVSPYESWTGQPLQVKLEDVFPMVAGQSLGSALGHSVHVYQGRLQYILTYYTSIADTSTALLIRDETMNVLRMSVM